MEFLVGVFCGGLIVACVAHKRPEWFARVAKRVEDAID